MRTPIDAITLTVIEPRMTFLASFSTLARGAFQIALSYASESATLCRLVIG
ncbi:hypothetical protein BwSH20_38100 [Bradyrhizobium ottawaense]|nr:hypothetical protein SG09_09210 [Bradyrhizobium ottawaense]GMO28693.1 hypothetical protein BwSH14_29850 [Bradyrhizobium ottawaense]GMO43145.1 hypothetical protein BwSF21_56120 [Bradyrhizobium ottawaense]GMO50449.1 hypothetical protein BwSF12_60000 [Bradyrhizobium ottawaense]GMO62167.1 hypothetical protein BwSG20_18330 [Bradyrhizobium ottawaense]